MTNYQRTSRPAHTCGGPTRQRPVSIRSGPRPASQLADTCAVRIHDVNVTPLAFGQAENNLQVVGRPLGKPEAWSIVRQARYVRTISISCVDFPYSVAIRGERNLLSIMRPHAGMVVECIVC